MGEFLKAVVLGDQSLHQLGPKLKIEVFKKTSQQPFHSFSYLAIFVMSPIMTLFHTSIGYNV